MPRERPSLVIVTASSDLVREQGRALDHHNPGQPLSHAIRLERSPCGREGQHRVQHLGRLFGHRVVPGAGDHPELAIQRFSDPGSFGPRIEVAIAVPMTTRVAADTPASAASAGACEVCAVAWEARHLSGRYNNAARGRHARHGRQADALRRGTCSSRATPPAPTDERAPMNA